MAQITSAKILIIAADGFEQSELEVPRDKLSQRGAQVHVASPKGETIKGWQGSDWGGAVSVDLAIEDADAGDYDAIVLPGGVINPDQLRVNDKAISLIRSFYNSGKLIAAICHAPWLLAEAGLLNGRDATSYHTIKTDVKNAGANWQDKAAVADAGIVTSRSPDDLDAFVDKIVEEIEEGRHERKAA